MLLVAANVIHTCACVCVCEQQYVDEMIAPLSADDGIDVLMLSEVRLAC